MSTVRSPAPTIHRWTRSEYHHLLEAGLLDDDDRVELIEGNIVHMSPQDSPHAVAVRLARRALRRIFPDEKYLVDEQLPLALAPDTEPEPDVSIIEGQPRDFLEDHPSSAVLVVEVADASLPFDRDRKGPLYARHDLPAYWIVNLRDRQIEVHQDPRGESYADVTVYQSSDTVPVHDESIAASELLP